MIDANDVQPMQDDGAELLNELLATLKRYVAFPDEHSPAAVTLWIAATHAVDAFECAPRLVFTSPQKRCGKSRVLDIITGTCHKPLATVDATAAAIFRTLGVVGDPRADREVIFPPTLIIDEADAIFGSKQVAEQNEDLRKLLNAGHQRGRRALRCVGPNQVPTEFNTFAFAALAGIGNLPDTITDRAVNIAMRRRASGEKVSQFRSRRDGPKLKKLRDRLTDWAEAHINTLTKAEPDMPVDDRAADTWEPLVAIADAAGGQWPELARDACAVLVARAEGDDEDRSLGVRLLTDIQDIFTTKAVPFLSSAELVAELRKVDESPWAEFDYNASKLAYRLKEYGVKPGHNTAKTARGYRLEDLTDVFSRYLRPKPSKPSKTPSDQEQSPDGLKPPDAPARPPDDSTRPGESTRPTENAGQSMFRTGWTGTDGGTAQNGSATPQPAAPATDEQHARYRNGMCRDCGVSKASAGRPRCDECHRNYERVMVGYDR